MLQLTRNSSQFHLTLGVTARRYFVVDTRRSHQLEGLLDVINQQDRGTKVFRTKKIYLEYGDRYKGLRHIIIRHARDFQKMLKKTEKLCNIGVARVIKKTILDGNQCTYRYTKYGRDGFSFRCRFNLKGYVFVMVSSTGSVVTAYPKSRP